MALIYLHLWDSHETHVWKIIPLHALEKDKLRVLLWDGGQTHNVSRLTMQDLLEQRREKGFTSHSSTTVTFHFLETK